MLNQPEFFHDLDKVRQLLDLMEKKSQVISLFQPVKQGITIRIGSENNHIAVENCSVITASYTAGEDQIGAIAIIGPTRMDYKRVVTLLDFARRGLSKTLSGKSE